MNTLGVPAIEQQNSVVANYFRALLTATGAIFLATLIPTFANAFRGLSSEKATGLAAVAGGAAESVLAPWFWLVFLLFFSLFYVAGGSAAKAVRIALFWIPASAISILGLGFWALFVYLAMHFGQR